MYNQKVSRPADDPLSWTNNRAHFFSEIKYNSRYCTHAFDNSAFLNFKYSYIGTLQILHAPRHHQVMRLSHVVQSQMTSSHSTPEEGYLMHLGNYFGETHMTRVTIIELGHPVEKCVIVSPNDT